MSYQEIAKNMIDKLPEDKLVFIINILENIGEMSGVDVYPEFQPNEETIAAEKKSAVEPLKLSPVPFSIMSLTSFIAAIVSSFG